MSFELFLKASSGRSRASAAIDFADTLHFPYSTILFIAFVCVLWVKQYIHKVSDHAKCFRHFKLVHVVNIRCCNQSVYLLVCMSVQSACQLPAFAKKHPSLDGPF